ncbi:MAG: hypothetical protein AB7K35_14755 [Pseudorhodoplanes sp.]
MTTPKEYLERADAALAELAEATTEAERTRLKRAHGVYLRLSNHESEAATRAAMGPAPRIVPERPATAASGSASRWTIK